MTLSDKNVSFFCLRQSYRFPDRYAAPASSKSSTAGDGSNSAEASPAAAAEASVSAYLQTKVDPVLAPLLQRLILAQPADVIDFTMKDLQTQKQSK